MPQEKYANPYLLKPRVLPKFPAEVTFIVIVIKLFSDIKASKLKATNDSLAHGGDGVRIVSAKCRVRMNCMFRVNKLQNTLY